MKYQKFQVIKRVEVPRGEYSYDNAVNKIIELNEIYNPAFIYCDAGSGEYQIERLHIYGDEHPSSGLKNKVKRWQFSNALDVIDPITGEMHKEPLKQFMVNQLTISFERDRMMLSPFDEVLAHQLQAYEVEKTGANGRPIFTSKDEHFVDAIGLAHLAFTLEFKELTNIIKERRLASKMAFSNNSIGKSGARRLSRDIRNSYGQASQFKIDETELRGERQTWFKVDKNYRSGKSSIRAGRGWGSRVSRGGRSSW